MKAALNIIRSATWLAYGGGATLDGSLYHKATLTNGLIGSTTKGSDLVAGWLAMRYGYRAGIPGRRTRRWSGAVNHTH